MHRIREEEPLAYTALPDRLLALVSNIHKPDPARHIEAEIFGMRFHGDTQNTSANKNPRVQLKTGAKQTGELGFEPRQSAPEALVLPLHHSPKRKTILASDVFGVKDVI